LHRGGQFVVRADLPGLNKDDITVEVNDDMLTIQEAVAQLAAKLLRSLDRAPSNWRRDIVMPAIEEVQKIGRARSS
jgi:HSP20 family molecular chaperone IbpA